MCRSLVSLPEVLRSVEQIFIGRVSQSVNIVLEVDLLPFTEEVTEIPRGQVT